MRPKRYPSLLMMILWLIAGALWIDPFPNRPIAQAAPALTQDTPCRFGIDSPLGRGEYDISSLHVGSYLDWGAVNNPSLPSGVEYIHVLRLRDDLYPETLANLPVWVAENPAGVWVVGNEPDTTYENQDALTPEVYAQRYYAVASLIRGLDPTSQIAFGSIVQPTPLRLRYLMRAWNRLVLEAGGTNAASRLVDIWSPHSFILNEEAGAWGTGIPPGFENDHDDAVIISNFDDTHSISIFQQRIFDFRSWMAGIGERDKPLWITEYGSLFPPVDPQGGPDYVNVSDADTALYMVNTFDFMLIASDGQSGMPADGNQLVQRWFWYSLNDHRYHFGGSLYNPDYPDYPDAYGPLITQVGQSFITYHSTLSRPDLLPLSLSITPISFNPDHTLVNYRLDVTIDNDQFTDATCGQLWIYDGDPDAGGKLIGESLPSSAFHPNYGTARVTTYWMGVQPLSPHTLYVLVEPVGIDDFDPLNNEAYYDIYTALPKLTYLPLTQRR